MKIVLGRNNGQLLDGLSDEIHTYFPTTTFKNEIW